MTDPRYKGELRKEAAAAYRAQGSVRKAAAVLGLSPSRTHKLLTQAGVLPLPQRKERG